MSAPIKVGSEVGVMLRDHSKKCHKLIKDALASKKPVFLIGRNKKTE